MHTTKAVVNVIIDVGTEGTCHPVNSDFRGLLRLQIFSSFLLEKEGGAGAQARQHFMDAFGAKKSRRGSREKGRSFEGRKRDWKKEKSVPLFLLNVLIKRFRPAINRRVCVCGPFVGLTSRWYNDRDVVAERDGGGGAGW